MATLLQLCSRIMQSGHITQSTVIRALETVPEGIALMMQVRDRIGETYKKDWLTALDARSGKAGKILNSELV